MKIFVWKSTNTPLKKSYSPEIQNDLRTSTKYSTVLQVMSCIGIDIGEKSKAALPSTIAMRLIGVFVAFLFHLSTIDYLFMSYRNLALHWEDYQVVISLLLSNTCSLALWHVMHSRKKSLKILIRRMKSMSDGLYVISTLEKSMLDLAIFFGLFVLPITFSVISAYLMVTHDPYAYQAFYTYGYKITNVTTSFYLYLFLKILSTCLLDPIFVSCVTFVYCVLCRRSCRLLSEYRKKLVQLLKSPNEPSNESLSKLTHDYSKICRILEKLQCSFSLPTFLMTIIDSMSSFTLLASALLYTPGEYTGPVIAENVYIFVTSSWLLVATIACAARIPIEMNKIRNCFQMMQEKALIAQQSLDGLNVRLLQSLKDRPVIVLSGCEIIYFTRVTILSALGTLFTYGLLIIQLKGDSKTSK
ncbi:hypothetical protein JTE90_011913 [Oedothorax gibbosus]|uniref:Gustatory receptor n=1 Tax=Oedothorax gibbosus TaxID=931172 RepID=A0AAV6V128_9ARAC|nr:hypothetical protein JTE90_011913 [Oedothorax gibbosus]